MPPAKRILDGLHVGTHLGLDGALSFTGVDADRARSRIRPNAGENGNAHPIEARDVGNARDAQLSRALLGVGQRLLRRRNA
jgi:hypothetical protein